MERIEITWVVVVPETFPIVEKTRFSHITQVLDVQTDFCITREIGMYLRFYAL